VITRTTKKIVNALGKKERYCREEKQPIGKKVDFATRGGIASIGQKKKEEKTVTSPVFR